MRKRSPSIDRICAAAVEHFSTHGYDGSSLNEIAVAVGMKKPSLYAHFSNKDALFLEAFGDAMEAERAFLEATFAGGDTQSGPGAAYIGALGERYAQSVHLRFLLRTVYAPPVALRRAVGQPYENFLVLLGALFRQQLRHICPDVIADDDAESYMNAYTGIVESLFVELIYADQEAMKMRAAALWRLLADSLRLRLGLNLPV